MVQLQLYTMSIKVKHLVSYFTAMVVFVILVLVLYTVSLLSDNSQLDKIHAERVVVNAHTLRKDPKAKDTRINSYRLQVSDPPNFRPLDLIPNFNSLPKQSLFKAAQSRNHHSESSHNRGPLHPQEYLEDEAQDEEEVTGNCTDDTCLRGEDHQRYSDCDHQAREMNTTPVNGGCTFLSKKQRDPVALVSFPGSGNTWVRGLLEGVTGICTGAVYCDISLRASGFTGEFIRSGSVLVVKTHKAAPLWVGVRHPQKLRVNDGQFGSAIFLVRNPFRALVAEWSRKVANDFHERTVHLDTHVKSIGKEWFGGNPEWNKFVYNQSRRWFYMIESWIYKTQNHPVLVVKYEALKKDTILEMQRILEFLDVPYTTEELQKQTSDGFSTFHRSHTTETFEHFSSEQKQWINMAIANATGLIGKEIDLTEYLEPKSFK